ncbi:MAG TPA: hypothetical protein VJ951_11035 [Bacteroidales bacterium]|nr:hypothetical protein [Bacteroidales bacterium]
MKASVERKNINTIFKRKRKKRKRNQQRKAERPVKAYSKKVLPTKKQAIKNFFVGTRREYLAFTGLKADLSLCSFFAF